MTKKQQPAFPRGVVFPENLGMAIKSLRDINSGMTLRQYYAAKAMQGLIMLQKFNEGNHCDTALTSNLTHGRVIAEWAFRYADCMIEFEEKEGEA